METIVTPQGEQEGRSAIKSDTHYLKDVKFVLNEEAKSKAEELYKQQAQTQFALPGNSDEKESFVKLNVDHFMQKFAVNEPHKKYHNHLAWKVPFNIDTLTLTFDYTSFDDPRAPASLKNLKYAFPQLFRFDTLCENYLCLRDGVDGHCEAGKVHAALSFVQRTTMNGVDYASIYIKPLVFENSSVKVVAIRDWTIVQVELEYSDGEYGPGMG